MASPLRDLRIPIEHPTSLLYLGWSRLLDAVTNRYKEGLDDANPLTENETPDEYMLLRMDPEKMANRLVILQYFDMEIYTMSHQERGFDSLLKLLHEQGRARPAGADDCLRRPAARPQQARRPVI